MSAGRAPADTRSARGAPGAVVVTGASSGIGASCAEVLTGAGFVVFAGVRQDEDAWRLESSGRGNVVSVMLDVTDQESLERAACAVSEELAVRGVSLKGLVNNAGVHAMGPLEFLPLEEFRRVMEVNAVGPLATARAFLPELRRGGGRIVNVGSINGRLRAPYIGAYCASKFALEPLTDALRMEMERYGVKVSLVEPGAIKTPMWDKYEAQREALYSNMTEEARKLYGADIEAAADAGRRVARAGQEPASVARVILRALTEERPKTRYLVGLDARAGATFAKVLPDRLLDGLTRWYMRLPRHPPAGF